MARPKLRVVGLEKREPFTFVGYRRYAEGRKKLVDLLQFVAHNDGVNGTKLSKKANCAPSTVYNLFSGRTRFPRSDTLWRICQAMNLPDAVFNVHLIEQVRNSRPAKSRKRRRA